MITKALIPMAGLGTRMGPLARAVPKGMFPLIDPAGRVRPVVHFITEEARAAGVERVALIISPGHEDILRKYFAAANEALPAEAVDIEYIVQPKPEGFGEAVARGAAFIGDDPFLLLLGDHVHKAPVGGLGCAAQVTKAFVAQDGCAMIGMQTVDEAELPRVGTAAGEEIGDRLYRCTAFIEKPKVEQARAKLRMPNLPQGQYLAHAGIYVFTPEVVECLSRLAAGTRPAGAEIQLVDAQLMLLQRHPQQYYLYHIDGRAYDTGTPTNFLLAQKAIGT